MWLGRGIDEPEWQTGLGVVSPATADETIDTLAEFATGALAGIDVLLVNKLGDVVLNTQNRACLLIHDSAPGDGRAGRCGPRGFDVAARQTDHPLK